MKKFSFKIRGNNYDTVIKKFDNNIIDIEINGTKYKVEYEHEVAQTKTPTLVRARVQSSPKDAKIEPFSSNTTIVAPLPGTIFEIKVKEGDLVKRGDVLLVMEAMKMENNILAENDGTITSIKVAVGDSVLQNDTLIELS